MGMVQSIIPAFERIDAMATCKFCGEEIIWTVTRKGKKMPVDAEPVSKGKFILDPENELGDVPAVFIGDKDKYTGERYDSHFETCPARQRGGDGVGGS